MQSTHETFTGVILRDTVYKDADKILTILARGKGIITAKARGAMKTGSPLAVGCQCFCYGEFTTYEYGGKLLVEKADVIDQFEGLRTDLASFALAGYVAELTEQFGVTDTPEDESLYRLVLNTLYALAYKPEIRRDKIKAAFELRLCSDCGFMPDLDGCMVCGTDEPIDPIFALESAQIFCRACFDGDEATFPLTPRLLDALRVVTTGELKKLLSFRLDAREGDIFCRLCEEYILLQIDPPESLKYYHSVKS
ncbi:MAG: DNA repair protein RecO [Ruminococcaceae bacterium]|nr:DNA repair protein RecO [Oscillospiraceae bacterium]